MLEKDIQRRKNSELSAEDRLLKAKHDSLRLLAVRPRSVEELRKRLKMKKYDDATIERTVDIFKSQNLLDDEKFARMFAGSRTQSHPSGRRQLERDLKMRGVSGDVIAKTMQEMQGYDEKKAARELVEGRLRQMKGLPDRTKKARLFGFLKRRGFGSDVVFAVMNDLFKGQAIEEIGNDES